MSDYTDRTLGLGYAKGSGLLIAILLGVFAFWRFSTKGSEHGGLGFGTIGSSFVLAAVLVAFVSFEIKTRSLPALAVVRE